MFNRLRQLAQLVSYKELRNAVLGLSVVFGGLGLAFVTLYAHRTGNAELAGTAAILSLAFVVLILIFVIPPLARSASAEASQMNLPFEFTTGGAIFFALIVIVAFAAFNTGNNLLFLVLSFIISALLVSFASGYFCLRKLDVKMRFSETIFAGEMTSIIVGLKNRKRIFPTFSVTAEVRGKERRYSKYLREFQKIVSEKLAKRISRSPIVKYTLDYFVFVPRNDSIENKVSHIFTRRGRFTISDFELSTRFPFGFFRHRRRLPAQKAELIVFPKIRQIEEIFDLPIDSGKSVSAKRGSGQDLFALREYQTTDDVRHIDWKATARANHLVVREFTAEVERHITVVFDPAIEQTIEEKEKSLRRKIKEENSGRTLSETEKRFEKGVSKAASLLAHFCAEDSSIRLMIDDSDGAFGNSIDHLNQALRELALVEPVYESNERDGNLPAVLDHVESEYSNDLTFLVTASKPEEFSQDIRHRIHLVAY
ncbi:MAG: DUF58 domain-containing protein [Acidobacteria bacterium]|nr:DUF58 domain-containing protein [Acidobacteriota bacterium]